MKTEFEQICEKLGELDNTVEKIYEFLRADDNRIESLLKYLNLEWDEEKLELKKGEKFKEIGDE